MRNSKKKTILLLKYIYSNIILLNWIECYEYWEIDW